MKFPAPILQELPGNFSEFISCPCNGATRCFDDFRPLIVRQHRYFGCRLHTQEKRAALLSCQSIKEMIQAAFLFFQSVVNLQD